MTTFLQAIAPNVDLSDDHQHVLALCAHHNAQSISLDIHPFTPARIADYHATAVETTTDRLLKQLRDLEPLQSGKPNCPMDMLLTVRLAMNQIASRSHRSVGNNVILSLNNFDLLKRDSEDLLSDLVHLHPDEHMKDDEMIVTYYGKDDIIDAGMFIANYPSGDTQTCLLPYWDRYYQYIKFV